MVISVSETGSRREGARFVVMSGSGEREALGAALAMSLGWQWAIWVEGSSVVDGLGLNLREEVDLESEIS